MVHRVFPRRCRRSALLFAVTAALALGRCARAATDPVEIRLDRCVVRWTLTEGLTVRCDGRLLLGGSTSPVTVYPPGWAWSHGPWGEGVLSASVSSEAGRQVLRVQCNDPKLSWQQVVTAGPGDRFRVAYEFTQVAWDEALNYEVCLCTPAVGWFTGARFQASDGAAPATGEIPPAFAGPHPIPASSHLLLETLLGRLEINASQPLLFYDYPQRANFWLGRDDALPRGKPQGWFADIVFSAAPIEVAGLRLDDLRFPEQAERERAVVGLRVTRLAPVTEPVQVRLRLNGSQPLVVDEATVPADPASAVLRLSVPLPGPGAYQVGLELSSGGKLVYASPPLTVVAPQVLLLRPGRVPFQDGDQGELLASITRADAAGLTLVVSHAGDELYRGPAQPGPASVIPIPLERLPRGRSDLVGALWQGDDRVASARAEVYALERKSTAVVVDAQRRCLLVNGLPFCPQGCYVDAGGADQVLQEGAATGVNVMAPYLDGDPAVRRQGRAALRTLFDRCAQAGVYLQFDIRAASKAPHSEEKWQWLAEEIAEFRDHPALLSYYLADEPELGWASPEDALVAYRRVRDLDPWHPVTMVFCQAEAAGRYAAAMDVVMTDPYPIPNAPVVQVAEFCERIRRDTADALPLWLVPQAFGGGEWWRREPSRQEERVMTYLGLIHGAKGVQYFIRRPRISNPNSPDLWGECQRLLLELSQLTPALCSAEPAPAVSASSPEVHVAAFRERGTVTVLAANLAPRPLAVDFRLQAPVEGEVAVLFENRALPAHGGSWSDLIDAMGTRVYRLGVGPAPAAQASLDARNLVQNPSFEEAHNTGTPDGSYIGVADQLSSWFLDPRTAVHGRQSLRLCTASSERGVRVAPFPLALTPGKRYRLSVWGLGARAGLRFALELDAVAGERAIHELGAEWREFAIDFSASPQASARSQVALHLLSVGTAWFDALQVYPLD